MRPDVPHQFPLLLFLATTLLWEGTKAKRYYIPLFFSHALNYLHVNLFTSQQYKVFGLKWVKYNSIKMFVLPV